MADQGHIEMQLHASWGLCRCVKQRKPLLCTSNRLLSIQTDRGVIVFSLCNGTHWLVNIVVDRMHAKTESCEYLECKRSRLFVIIGWTEARKNAVYVSLGSQSRVPLFIRTERRQPKGRTFWSPSFRFVLILFHPFQTHSSATFFASFRMWVLTSKPSHWWKSHFCSSSMITSNWSLVVLSKSTLKRFPKRNAATSVCTYNEDVLFGKPSRTVRYT